MAKGEAIGLLKAIQWIISMQYNFAIFESDCKVIVDELVGHKHNNWEQWVTDAAIRGLLHNNSNYSVKFDRGNAN